MAQEYRIGELAEKSGVTRRTIHYYMARGLLPASDGAGLGTTYREEHLDRIMLIKRWQDAFLPLEEIKKRLSSMTHAQVKEALHGKVDPPSGGDEPGVPAPFSPEGLGMVYQRILLGHGVEIHYPAGSGKAKQLVEALYRAAENLMKEG